VLYVETDFGTQICTLLTGTKKENSLMRDKVQAAIDKIRPALQKDGGDVILIDVTDDGIVKVQLTGACKGCPMSQMTLKEGIEKFVKSEIPEIISVESV
jgi:Fe-S cluster biogenesis protein NfuA